MKRISKKAVSVVMTFAIAASVFNVQTSDAKAPKLSTKNIKINEGGKKVLKLKNGSKKAKVTWKINKSSIAKLSKKVTKGNKASVTVKGVKKGSAKITAIYKIKGGNKKFTCNVKVMKKAVQEATVTPAGNNIVTASPTVVPVVTPTIQPTAVPTETPTPTAKVITADEAVNVIGNIPSDYKTVRDDVDYGTFEGIKYHSNITNSMRSANVFLPEGYDDSDYETLYPVVYLMHGIGQYRGLFGMSVDQSSVAHIAGNAVANGLTKKFIIVCPDIRVSDTRETDNPDPNNPNEVKTHSLANYKFYDDFREDLINNLMPYMEENFNVATGRENTAVCGFSMGGRESLYIGISKPEFFGYVGGLCPAFGLVDYENANVAMGEDSLFGAPENLTLPKDYINNTYIQITAGTNDTVVNKQPLEYYQILQENNVPILYAEVQNGYHGDNTYDPGFYNFILNVFPSEEAKQ